MTKIADKTDLRFRAQIKNEAYLETAIDVLKDNGFDVHVNNPNGDVLYIWTDGQMKAEKSHWTNDDEIHEIDASNFGDFISDVKELADLNKASTDYLINRVISMGLPLPVYDYESRMFMGHYPVNLRMGDCVAGDTSFDFAKDFRQACIKVIKRMS